MTWENGHLVLHYGSGHPLAGWVAGFVMQFLSPETGLKKRLERGNYPRSARHARGPGEKRRAGAREQRGDRPGAYPRALAKRVKADPFRGRSERANGSRIRH